MAKERQFKSRDYVVGLITGRWIKVRDTAGKVTEEFQPQVENPNLPMKHLLRDVEGRAIDRLFVTEGLRVPRLRIDTVEFEKSNKQRRYLKHLKRVNKREVIAAGFDPKKRLNVSDPMYLTNRI